MNKLAAAMAVALGGTMLSGAQPARAHTEICAAQGMRTGGLAVNYFVRFQPTANVDLSFSLPAVCSSFSGTLAISLSFSGWCEFGNGSGTVNGHAVNFTAANGIVTLTGQVVGDLRIVGDSDPCAYRAANWLVSASVVVPA